MEVLLSTRAPYKASQCLKVGFMDQCALTFPLKNLNMENQRYPKGLITSGEQEEQLQPCSVELPSWGAWLREIRTEVL